MSKTTTRSILACVAAVPLSIALATPAAAAPGDVTYSVTTAGATVASTFTNNSDAEIQCEFFGLDEPYDPETEYDASYPYAVAIGTLIVPAGQSASMTDPGVGAPELTVGQRVFIEWACVRLPISTEFDEVWGTPVIENIDENLGGPFQPTARAQEVVVGVGVVPEPPVDVCTGSACLPTGSFGF